MTKQAGAALLLAALLVCSGCGLVLRREEGQPVSGVADMSATDEVEGNVAPALPPTTVWVEPEVVTPVAGGEPLVGELPPVPSSDPLCIALDQLPQRGYDVVRSIGADVAALRQSIVELQQVVSLLTQQPQPEVAQPAGALSEALAGIRQQADSTASVEEVRQSVTDTIAGFSPLVNEIFGAATSICPGVEVPYVSAAEGFEILSEQGDLPPAP